MKSKKRAPASPLLLAVAILALNAFVVDGWLLWNFFHGHTRVLGTSDTCPQSCKNLINQSGRSNSGTKEYFIPLGSGSGSGTDWMDIPGAQATINSALYPSGATVTFEATLSVPNASQIVWARLYNETDKHPVWHSEVTTNQSGPLLLTSAPVNLDPGNDLYVVQVKTQLGGTTQVHQARVHIVTK